MIFEGAARGHTEKVSSYDGAKIPKLWSKDRMGSQEDPSELCFYVPGWQEQSHKYLQVSRIQVFRSAFVQGLSL